MRIALVAVLLLASGCAETRDPDPDAEDLGALGYVSWSPIREGDESKSGVTFWDRDRSHAGINLYNSLPWTRAMLTDMEGQTLHGWEADTGKEWGHIELLPDGGLLILNEHPSRLICLDPDSSIRWSHELEVHHDADVTDDGEIYVLTGAVEQLHRGDRPLALRNDYLVLLSPAGEIRGKLSFLRVLRDRIDLDDIARFAAGQGSGATVDPAHVNTLSILRRDYGAGFPRGAILFAARSLNLIGVVDPRSGELLWSWGEDELDWPHQPTLLESGNVLVFDNGAHRGWSRIVEVDPRTRRIVWEYRADPPEAFFSRTMGGIEVMPNGNVLITESERGRVFEIDREGTVVWEFFNPDIDESTGRRAAIYRMMRLDPALLPPALHPGSM